MNNNELDVIKTIKELSKSGSYSISINHYRYLSMISVGGYSTAIRLTPKEFFALPRHITDASLCSMIDIRDMQLQNWILAKGGYTTVLLNNHQTGVVSSGIAICHPEDHFTRKRGIQEAFVKARQSELEQVSNNLASLT